MKIIGHRGAAGLALENTLPSIELARLLGVDAIEMDVRITKDRQLVLCHDADLSRISSSHAKVADLTLKELQKITLNDEQSVVPTLHEALKMADRVPVIIEIKQSGCAKELLELLSKFPDRDITITSFKLEELAMLRALAPEMRLFANEKTKPFDIIHLARKLKLNGVGLNFWLLNPLTYLLLKRHGMDLFVYTLNNRLIGHFVRILYPDAAICTNHPEWYIKHPWLKLRSSHLDAKIRKSGKSKSRRKRSARKAA